MNNDNLLIPELLAAFSKLSEHHLVKALDQLIVFAVEKNVSDIHFEVHVENFRIRLRIDGVLYQVIEIPLRFASLILSRLKILANLDIAEKRLPQDGRLQLIFHNLKIEGRINTCPTILGEKAVIRLLPSSGKIIPLMEQGITEQQFIVLQELIQSPHGLVIVTGPTGSGKTMTLYGLLSALNTEHVNLISMEDPVEMMIPGVNQIQIQEKTGLEFKNLLRSLLRQDPDIIMIGEIRDTETAEIAIKAAQTGHLVLSTLHTASSLQALLRLEQLGLPRYLIVEATRLIIAQRLVRRTCPPCSKCINGFLGRTGIFELLKFTQEVQLKLLNNEKIAVTDYVDATTLESAGRLKIDQGVTTDEEVRRVV